MINKINIKSFLLIFAILFTIFACKKVKLNPENIFTKIYNDSNSDISYYPLDIIQSSDGGYYILSGLSVDTNRTFLSTHISKTNKFGELLWENTLNEQYVNPVSGLISNGTDISFICMDRISLGTYLMTIDDANGTANVVSTFDDILYPLVSSQTSDNGFLLLSYDRDTRSSMLTKFNSSFTETWNNTFSVVEDVEEMLIAHLTRSCKPLPFFAGTIESGGGYFVNALYNYSLAMIFVNSSNGVRTGLIYGDRYNAGISAAISVQFNNFAVSKFVFNNHYYLPSASLSLSSITSSDGLSANRIAELNDAAHTLIKKIIVDSKEIAVYASNTSSNQILLIFYDLNTGDFIANKYLGHSNPVEIAEIIQTSDNGLAILAQTIVAGRFKRTALYKIPKEQILE